MLLSVPLAFIISLVGSFRDSPKGWAIAGVIISGAFGLRFIALPWLVSCGL